MALTDVIKSAVATAFTAVGDIAVSTNYLSFVSTSINASSGAATTTYSTRAGVKVIFDEFRVVDGSIIRPEDKRAYISVDSLASAAVSDVISEDGTEWQVVRVSQGPARSLWDLQVRRP